MTRGGRKDKWLLNFSNQLNLQKISRSISISSTNMKKEEKEKETIHLGEKSERD